MPTATLTVTARPRRRTRTHYEPKPPRDVLLTRDYLNFLQFSGTSIHAAADLLGLRLTALKHACRALGIDIWRGRDCRGHARLDSAFSSALAEEPIPSTWPAPATHSEPLPTVERPGEPRLAPARPSEPGYQGEPH